MKLEKLGRVTKNLDNKRIPLNSSQRDRKSKEGLYPYIGANNIMGYINEYIFDEKILCLAEDGGSWGDGQICANIYNEKCWVNNHAHVLTENGKANLEYLRYFLNKEDLNKYITGSTRGKLTKTALENILVPLPPIADQLHIANILSKAENLISQRKQSIALLDEFLKSTFLEMFGDPVRNEKKVKMIELGKLGNWKSGGTPLRSRKDFFVGDIPWLTSGELNNIYLSDSKEKISEEAILNSNASKIPIGSLLLGMYDTAALKSSINREIVACNQAIAFAKLEDHQCNTVFVYYTIQIGREYFRSQQRGVRQKNMNLSMIKGLKILHPPLALQTQFAQIVEKTEALKVYYQSSLQELENLYGSLSQRAFRGELTLNQAEEQILMAAEPEIYYNQKL